MAGLNYSQLLIGLFVLVASLSVHEAAHAWAADQLGDPTARHLGRLSLNPAVHADLIGTVLFPLVAMSTGLPLIGWAKPVPVDVRYLRSPRRDFALIAAAGPASNLVLAVIAAGLLTVLPGVHPGDITGRALLTVPKYLLQLTVVLNVLLAVFNMLPVPPLDGGNVLLGVLPRGAALVVERVRPYGFIILYALMLTGVLGAVAAPVQELAPLMAAVTKPRVMSGMRPTGKLHLGHLVGALQNWTRLQTTYDCFYGIVDWHALTTNYADTSEIVGNAIDNIADWIGAGLDPEQSTFFVQSLVPEHAELYLLLQMVTPIPWLERVPTYKEQMDQLTDKDLSTIGFLGYPLLQAADIIIYNANVVPVGEDQVPHIELTREVVRRFNNIFGEVFVEPQTMLTPTPRLPGLDNRKMSKSYNNTIDLSDDVKTVQAKVRQMYTDPKRVRADIPGTVEGNPVFLYHDAFNANTAEVDDLKARYREGKVGDVEVKTKLATALNAVLEPIRERREAALARPGYLRDVLVDGSMRARRVAQDTMARVRAAVKLTY